MLGLTESVNREMKDAKCFNIGPSLGSSAKHFISELSQDIDTASPTENSLYKTGRTIR